MTVLMHQPRLEVVTDINQVDPELWDSVAAPANLQTTHRFIKCCQESAAPDTAFWHVLVFEDGRLAAVASLCRMIVGLELLSSGATRTAIRSLRRLRSGFLQVPVIFCGLPVSFGQSGLAIAPGAQAGVVLASLGRLADDLARREGAPMVCFKEFGMEQAGEIEALGALGFFRARSLPGCFLPLRWASFGAYVGDLRAGYRRQVLATLQQRAAAGLEVRVRKGVGCDGPEVLALYEQVMDRAAHQLERLDRRFFDALDRNLPGEVRTILLQRQGRVLGCAVLLLAHPVVTFLLAGFDHAGNREHHLYHNVVLEVVAEAIRSGAARLEMGQTSYELKSRLGALQAPRVMYLRHRGRVGHALLKRASSWLFPAVSYPVRRVFKNDAHPADPLSEAQRRPLANAGIELSTEC